MTTLKPYPAYTDTDLPWLGQIPAHWDAKPLFAVMKEKQRKNTGNKESNVLSLSYGTIKRRDVESNFGLLPESFETYQIVEPGNIVLRLTDLQNDKRSLRTGHVQERGIITSAYTCLEVNKQMNDKFAHYVLYGYDLLKVFYQLGAGVRQTMKFEDLRRLLVLVPPLPEQQAIAAYLDRQTAKIDALIAKKQQLLDLLAEKRAALISQAVTKGLNPNVEMKDSGVAWLGQVPNHWRVKRLKYIATIQNGLTLGQKYEGLSTISRPYLRVANVQDGYLDLNDVAEINLPIEKVSQYRLENGDVLMTEGGDFDKLGRGYVWEGQIEGCLHQNHIFVVRPDSNQLDSYFLSALLMSSHGKNYFTSTSQQTTNLATTNATKLKAFPILLPPIQEQKEILAYIDKQTRWLIQLENKVTAAIEHLQEYRAALISSVVTGKVKVEG